MTSCVIGAPKKERVMNRNIFQELIAKKSSNLMKPTNSHIQQNQRRINGKKNKVGHIIIKLAIKQQQQQTKQPSDKQ